MNAPTDQWIFWLITGIVGLLITVLLILFQRNISITAKQTEATNELSRKTAVLDNTVTNFRFNCEKIEGTTEKRLDAHAKSLKIVNGQLTKHGIMIEEHSRRIKVLEQGAPHGKGG